VRARTAAAHQHALAAGFDRAFLVAAGIMLLTLVTAVALVRDRRARLAGLDAASGGRAADQVEQVGQPLPDATA
jgi:hypothetical protein